MIMKRRHFAPQVIVVRRPTEKRRASEQYKQEGYRKSRCYIIVDDLISTGTTAARVIRGVRNLAPRAGLIGILLYSSEPRIIEPTLGDQEPYWYSWHNVEKCVLEMDEKEAAGRPVE